MSNSISIGAWEIALADKACDGCSSHIKKGDQYMVTKFTFPKEDNLIYLHTLFLCDACITQFEEYTQDRQDDPI